MPARLNSRRIFVAGASGFLGASVVYALLEEGAEVTALVPSDAALPVRPSERVQIVEGDAWNPGSLAGRSRGHGAVIHLVGSLRQQPARGLTYAHLNVTSLRNITRMAIMDGVPHLLFLSAAGSPWLPGGYVDSKREAERYLHRSGIPRWTIIRAPLVYPRGGLGNPLLLLFAGLGAIPLLGRPVARWAPLPVDVAARGIARLALAAPTRDRIVFGRDLRRLNAGFERRLASPPIPAGGHVQARDDEPPFGWLP
jgi:NADH dehydrogenase